MAQIIQKRRDTAANFTAANTLLAQGEEAYETDTGNQKRGDGVTLWNSLAYLTDGGDMTAAEIRDALETLTPGNRIDAAYIDNLPGGDVQTVNGVGPDGSGE